MFDLETIVAMNQPKVTALKVGEQRKPEVSAQTATYRIHTENVSLKSSTLAHIASLTHRRNLTPV
jgi:hypothetical protein